MAQVKNGDTVKVHYTGKLDDGTTFDTSSGRDPLEFKVGEGRVIPGFEKAIVGMGQGDTKTVTIPVDEAYGPRKDELQIVVNRTDLPAELDPKVGDELELSQGDREFVVRVIDANPTSVTLDANHPLAGEDLTFEIELVEIT